MKDHESEFSSIKNYYNDITHNNLDLIKSLKDEVAEMKKKEQADEQRMNEIHKEHTRMSEPLKKARKDVEFLSRELTKYKKEKVRKGGGGRGGRSKAATLYTAEHRTV